MDSMKLNDQAIHELNVRCVMSTLDSLRSGATENELLTYFQRSPEHLVQQEIKRILKLGIKNGFIVRNADKFQLPSLEGEEYQIDGGEDSDMPSETLRYSVDSGKRSYVKRMSEQRKTRESIRRSARAKSGHNRGGRIEGRRIRAVRGRGRL